MNKRRNLFCSYIYMWNKSERKTCCHEWDSNSYPADYWSSMLPLHHRDNHAGNIAISLSVDVHLSFPASNPEGHRLIFIHSLFVC